MSKIYPKWNAEIRGGRLVFEDQEAFSKYLIPYNNKQVHVVVKRRAKSRSRQEEKFYHAVVVRMVAEAMDTEDGQAHEFLRSLFLTTEESNIVDGKRIRYTRVKSTTELTDDEYRKFWEKCIRWASLPTSPSGLGLNSGLELYIPYPNEVEYE